MTTKAELHREVHEWRERCQGYKDSMVAANVKCHAAETARGVAEGKLAKERARNRKLKRRNLKLRLKLANRRIKDLTDERS